MIKVNNRDELAWKDGMTVQDVLNEMGYHYALITVTVNQTLIAHEDYNTTTIPDQADVNVFHLAHGG